MICEKCHGTGAVTHKAVSQLPALSPTSGGVGYNVESCDVCHGSGVVYCCEGERAQPAPASCCGFQQDAVNERFARIEEDVARLRLAVLTLMPGAILLGAAIVVWKAW